MELRDRLQSTLGDAYSVERELGGGGMSRVFLARETALGRNVVVKVLSGDAVAGLSAERFAREVRLAASLQHPNIVPVLATGVADGIPYYTMPYVKGESLRARMKEMPGLPQRQAMSILRDVARALQHAHGEGVIHRDIKPDNILLSGDAAVVTDFGIAKAISAAQTSGTDEPVESSGLTLTRAGSTVGTPAYMAPEQAAGDKVDHRADLYAWGLVAYELLAGVHPFAGRTTATQLIAAQMSEIPAALDSHVPGIPPGVADLVMRALEKNPDDRPVSAVDLLEHFDASQVSASLAVSMRPRSSLYARASMGLVVAAVIAGAVYLYLTRQNATPVTAAHSSVAVLPFADERADSTEAYFGEGIADELMTALGKVPGLRVASRTSSIAVARRHDLDVREIGRQLGVSAVVEGTVRRSGGQLRVTAQLTNARDGLTLWSETYERQNANVFALQDDITQAIVTALRPELAGAMHTAATKKTGPGTSDPEAYDLYLRGLYLVERRGPGVAQAAEYFRQAIAEDPKFARAYAALAGALELFPYFAGTPAYKIEPEARRAAERSLELDSTLAEPRMALAMAHWHGLRWTEAEREFRRGIGADSTSPVARTQFGRYLMSTGRIPEAVQELRTARRLDPLAGTASVMLSHALAMSGDHAAAWEESKRARELDATLGTARTVLAFDRIDVGRPDEARQIAGETVTPFPFTGMTAYIWAKTGDTAKARAVRKMLDEKPDTTWLVHTMRAYAYFGVGDTARVLSELESGFASREIVPHAMFLADRLFDSIRQSPRFAAILKRAGMDRMGFTGPTGGRPAR